MRNPDAPQRLRSLDVLRGFAIVGTLGTNIWVFTSVGSDFGRLKENAEAAIATAGTGAVWTSFDSAASALSGVLTNGKFLALLSIMFGVGMAVQFDSARRRGQRWPWRYLWRALLLLADGFVHYLLVVEFDILMGYALTSMVVAPLLLLRTRWLVVATVVAGGVHLALETLRAVQGMASFAPEAMRRLTAGSEYPDMLSAIDGSYLDQVSNRLTYFWEFRVEAFLISPPLSAFLFLCGALLWRSGVFTDAATRRRVSRRLAVLGLGIGFPPLPAAAAAPAGRPHLVAGPGVVRPLHDRPGRGLRLPRAGPGPPGAARGHGEGGPKADRRRAHRALDLHAPERGGLGPVLPVGPGSGPRGGARQPARLGGHHRAADAGRAPLAAPPLPRTVRDGLEGRSGRAVPRA
jgi:uncharacterized membrane protein YeiB